MTSTIETFRYDNGDMGYVRPRDGAQLDLIGSIDDCLAPGGLAYYSHAEIAFFARYAEESAQAWRRAAADLLGASSATHTAATSAALWEERATKLLARLAEIEAALSA